MFTVWAVPDIRTKTRMKFPAELADENGADSDESAVPSIAFDCTREIGARSGMRPILLAVPSVNHNAPSGPAVIAQGLLSGVGVANSVTAPEVVILAMRLPDASTNHN